MGWLISCSRSYGSFVDEGRVLLCAFIFAVWKQGTGREIIDINMKMRELLICSLIERIVRSQPHNTKIRLHSTNKSFLPLQRISIRSFDYKVRMWLPDERTNVTQWQFAFHYLNFYLMKFSVSNCGLKITYIIWEWTQSGSVKFFTQRKKGSKRI